MAEAAHAQLGRMRLWNDRYSAPPPMHATAALRVLAQSTAMQAFIVGVACACIARFAFADVITPSEARAPSAALCGGWFIFAVMLYTSACYFTGGGDDAAARPAASDDI